MNSECSLVNSAKETTPNKFLSLPNLEKTVAYTPTIYTDHTRSMNQEHGHMQHSCVGLQGHLMCSSKALAHAQHNQGLHGLSAEPP